MFTMKLFKTMFTWKNMITQIIICQMFAIVLAAHSFSLNFKFSNYTLCQVIIYATYFHSLVLLISFTDMDNTARDKIRDNLRDNTKVTIMKFVGKFCLQFIVACVLVYVLTTFRDNLLLAVLGLSDNIVFTIYGVWCTIVVMYPLVLSYLFVVSESAWIKKRDIPVETTMLLKVTFGYLVNSILMSPLILNVGDELGTKWGIMMKGMAYVGFLIPIFVMCMLRMILIIEELINSLCHNIMKKLWKQG